MVYNTNLNNNIVKFSQTNQTTNTKKFYIVATTQDIAGIGAILIGQTSHALYAIGNGFTPIIDLKHYKNQYFKDGRTYKDNSWEYFFEQPCGYTLDDIDSNSEVIISNNIRFPANNNYKITTKILPISKIETTNISSISLKQRYQTLFKFNPSTKQYVKEAYSKIIKDDTNVLGVLCRGTDYTIRRSFGEPIQPTAKQVIKKVHEFLKKHPEITKIYLATEDNSIYEIFKNEFGERLIDNNQYRYSYSREEKPFLCDIKTERPNHNYQLALEYLSSLYILSKCKYFVGGRCAGSLIAWIMQNSWQDMYIWKLGYYGVNLLDKLFSKTTEYKDGKDYVLYHILGMKFRTKFIKLWILRACKILFS